MEEEITANPYEASITLIPRDQLKTSNEENYTPIFLTSIEAIILIFSISNPIIYKKSNNS